MKNSIFVLSLSFTLFFTACESESKTDVNSIRDDDTSSLGYNTTDQGNVIVEVKKSTIAAGREHTLILSENGDVYGFGRGQKGQNGFQSEYYNIESPTLINSLPKIISIAAAGNHSLALSEDGYVYSFGSGYNGAIGLGDEEDSFTATKIEELSNIVSISTALNHSLALDINGSVYSFGGLALGHGEKEEKYFSPKKIESLSNIVAIATGTYHSLVLDNKGDVYSFGYLIPGALGLGDFSGNVYIPTKITSLSNIVSISASYGHSHVIDKNGVLYSFGISDFILIDDSASDFIFYTEPTRINLPAGTIDIKSNELMLAVLDKDGSVYTKGFGEKGYGDTGVLGHAEDINVMNYKKVERLNNIVAISIGGGHFVALDANGSIFTFGRNYYGQLGLNDEDDTREPEQVIFTNTSTPVKIAIPN